jgi:hypothetical protein
MGDHGVIDAHGTGGLAALAGGAAPVLFCHFVDVVVGQDEGVVEPGLYLTGQGEIPPVDSEQQLGTVARNIPGIATGLVDLAGRRAAGALRRHPGVEVENRPVVGALENRREGLQESARAVLRLERLDLVAEFLPCPHGCSGPRMGCSRSPGRWDSNLHAIERVSHPSHPGGEHPGAQSALLYLLKYL